MTATATVQPAPEPLTATTSDIGDVVEASEIYRHAHLRHLSRAQQDLALGGWVGVIVGFELRGGVLLAICGQRPVACGCHLDFADDERPEVSRRDCLDCRGDGEAYWRARPLADLQRCAEQRVPPGVTTRAP